MKHCTVLSAINVQAAAMSVFVGTHVSVEVFVVVAVLSEWSRRLLDLKKRLGPRALVQDSLF
jgi:hypothetical protein